MFALTITFILVGLLARPACADWQWSNPSPHGDDLTAVAFGKGYFVAAGNNVVFLSTNGTDWSRHVTPTVSGPLKSIAFGKGRFVATTPIDFVWSPNGIDWIFTAHSGYLGNNVLYVGGQFISAGQYGIYFSRNGIDWSGVFTGWNVRWSGIANGNGRFVVVGSGGNVLVSSNGRSWRPRIPALGEDLTDIDYHSGTFVATARSNVVYTSRDGLDWQRRTIDPRLGLESLESIRGRLFTSPLGHELFRWDTREASFTRPVASIKDWTFGKGLYVGVGLGTIVTSRKPNTWQTYSAGPQIRVQDFASLNGVTVAVGGSRTAPGTDGGILLQTNSPAGLPWIQVPRRNEDLFAIDVFHDEFVAVGANGTVLTSTDGLTWESHLTGFTNTLRWLTPGPDLLVAVGHEGLIATSPDARTWTVAPAGTNDWTSVAWGNDRYLACGPFSTGVSTNGRDWIVQGGSGNSVVWDGGRFVLASGGIFSAALSSTTDGFHWDGTAPFPGGVSKLTPGPGGYMAVGPYGRVTWFGNAAWIFQTEWSSFAEFEAVRRLNGIYYVGGVGGRIFSGTPKTQ